MKKKIAIIFLLMLTLCGCTKRFNTEVDVDGKKVEKSYVSNIICRPESEELKEIYSTNKDNLIVDYDKLPACKNLKINSGGYEGLWTSIFVKPLAWVIIQIGNIVKNYGLSLVIVSLIIRLIAFPVTRKTAMQSEMLKNAKPELDKLEKKYKDKTDQESLMKKNQEMMLIYKKYNVNPVSGCLFSFIQLPLFIGFLEAINRVPAIFEEHFIGFQLGTTPIIALQHGNFLYLLLTVIVGLTTYYSFKNNTAAMGDNKQAATMNRTMVIMITVMSLFMTSALNIYWITTNLFTVVQNLLVKRGKKHEKK